MQRLWNRHATVLPIILLGLTGSTVSLVLPGLLAAAGLEESGASRVISMEMMAAALSTVLVSPFLGRVNRRWLALAAVAIALGADLLATRPQWAAMLPTVRFAAGLAEGTVLAVAVAYVAGTPLPDRTMAFFVASNLSMATLILRALPTAVSVFGHPGAFWTLAVLAVASFIAGTTLSSQAGARPHEHGAAASAHLTATSRPASVIPIVMGLAANVVFFTGVGSVWPLMASFASQIDVPLAVTSRVLSDATLGGIAGAMLAAWLAVRCDRRTAFAGGTVAMLISLIVLANAAGATGFACSAVLFMASLMFLVPSYVSVLALADPQGRAAAFTMATQYAGLALGPMLASDLNSGGQYVGSLIAGGGLALVGTALMICTEGMAGGGRRTAEMA